MEYTSPSLSRETPLAVNCGKRSEVAHLFRIVVADAHSVIRDGMRRLLDREPSMRVVATAATAATVVEVVRNLRPDLLLFDSSMSGNFSLDILQQVSEISGIAVVLFTANLSREEALLAVRLGIRGILSKDAPVDIVLQCIRRVLMGEHWIERQLLAEAVRVPLPQANDFDLSSREVEIIRSIVSGACNKDIAQRLDISDLTVKRHLTNIYSKIGVTGRLELALFALAHNLAQMHKSVPTVPPAARLSTTGLRGLVLPT